MNDPFTPPPGGFGFGRTRSSVALSTSSGGRPVASSANTSVSTARDASGTARSSGGPACQAGFGGFGPGRGGRLRSTRRLRLSAAVRAAGAAGRRGKRGDVRAAILLLLSDRAMHGYEMIQEISDRSRGLWRPSPGSVYPTLQLLVDEGLIVGTESEGSKRLFELTDEGRAAADKVETPPWDEIAEGVDPGQVNLRTALGQLMGAVAQSAYTATEEQQQRIVDIVNNARREVYNILGETE